MFTLSQKKTKQTNCPGALDSKVAKTWTIGEKASSSMSRETELDVASILSKEWKSSQASITSLTLATLNSR